MGFKATKKYLLGIYNSDKWLSRKHPEGISKDVKEFSNYVLKGARVLDHGCDRGVASKLLVENGYRVTGYDFNPTAIREALEKYGREGIEFKKKDLTKLPEEPKYDAVFSRNVLTDLARAGKLDSGLRELYKITKKAA